MFTVFVRFFNGQFKKDFSIFYIGFNAIKSVHKIAEPCPLLEQKCGIIRFIPEVFFGYNKFEFAQAPKLDI